uniref:Reverse transcriptase n=1 Tax=Cannabis sativa TaxID=3483 RepID=A0A803P4L2_CANSA
MRKATAKIGLFSLSTGLRMGERKSADWCLNFPKATVLLHPIMASDHAPVVLDTQPITQKLHYPFRFLEVWTGDSRCGAIIKDAWSKLCYGQAGICVCRKLRETKVALKDLNKNVFGFCDQQLKRLDARLSILQSQHSEEACAEEAEVQLEIIDMEHKLKRIWKQKSRELWVALGDCNSKFFHTSTMIRRRRNTICALLNDGNRWIFDREGMGEYFSKKFCFLFTSQQPRIEDEFETLFERNVNDEDNVELCRVLSRDEIKAVVWKLNHLKAPGPDGFLGIFYRKYRDSVGEEICRMVQEFFQYGTLKPILDKLVSPFQSVFLPGRWIAECSVLTSEALHALNKIKGRRGFMAVKMDMHKTYNRLEWGFLMRVLKANGFNEKFCNIIFQCVSTVSFSILLNGAPLEPFSPGRGLRQGDPLSPYLLIMCSEVLLKLMVRSKRKSGLVFSPKVKTKEKALMHGILNMQGLITKEKYLENPFFYSAKKRDDFNFLKDKIMSRLEGWKAKQLSIAGRQTLISSILQSVPCYTMSTIKVPVTICSEMDSIIARFWWKGSTQHRERYHALRSWADCCQPKRNGGLGFRKFKDINMALLAKLAWYMLEGENSRRPWVQLLNAKYCKVQDFCSVQEKQEDSKVWFQEEKLVWKDLWKLKIHDRQKILLWRILSGCLPLKNRLGYILESDKVCGLCGEAFENDVHLFRDCHFARCLWFTCLWGILNSNLGNLNFEEWLLWLLEARNEALILFGACVLEHIWQCKNSLIFKGVKPNLANSIRLLQQRFKEFCEVLLLENVPVERHPSNPHSQVIWDLLLKVDASVFEGSARLCAMQVVDTQEEGMVLLQNVAVDSVLEAKFLAILKALMWTEEKKASAVLVESDSLIAVKALAAKALSFAWADALARYGRVSCVNSRLRWGFRVKNWVSVLENL